MEMQELSLEKFEEASEIVKKVTQETKLIYSEYFSERYGNKIYFKPENMQRTGAYKVRGAYYKSLQTSTDIPSFTRSMIWKLRPARAALRWRSSKNSRLWITFSFR